MEPQDNRLASIGSGIVLGVDAEPVVIEATMRGEGGAPRILGSVDAVVREAYHRILGAFVAQDLPSPRGTPLLNFAPADVRKTGAGFDLPMALALAAAGGIVPRTAVADLAAFGEVTLDGAIRAVPGIVPIALAARRRGWRRILAHPDDARRAALVPDIEAIGVRSLREAVHGLGRQPELLTIVEPQDALAHLLMRRPATERRSSTPDVADLRGLDVQKAALEIAAAGRHDLLFVGPPGSGKSALLRRLGDLLPDVGPDECLDVLKIHSTTGVDGSLTRSGRPFRAPHHSSSAASVLGGGAEPRPGEVTLAQHGVLFLDELPEFRREVLEGLRQPLEERCVTIGRALRTVTMPADFQLVAAMNPCPCGHHGDPTRACRCTPGDRRRYRARVSGPLLDRFDLRVPVPLLPPEAFHAPPDPRTGSAALRVRIAVALARQRERNGDALQNGRLDGPALDDAVAACAATRQVLDDAMRTFRMSGRSRVRVLRTARTIADLADRDRVEPDDVRQAVRLRVFVA